MALPFHAQNPKKKKKRKKKAHANIDERYLTSKSQGNSLIP